MKPLASASRLPVSRKTYLSMSIITPLFHNIITNQFCELYLCIYKKGKGQKLNFGMSCLPKDPNNPTELEHDDRLKFCWEHIANFDAVELTDFDTQISPVKGCDVKSYISNHYPTLVISEASKKGESVGWWVASLDYEDEPESCIPLVSVKPPKDEKAEEAWFNACLKLDKKLNK